MADSSRRAAGAGPTAGGGSAVDSELEALGERFRLPASAVPKLGLLLQFVLSDPFAPTSIREPRRVLADHFADSLVALEVDELRAASSVADLGSGAGFPGLPLAAALPSACFALIESAARKAAFIKRAISACRIGNARPVSCRIESWVEGVAQCDLVLARALAPLDVVFEYAAPLLRLGGLLVVWRGRRSSEAEKAGERAARVLGLQKKEIRAVRPYPGAERRHLHLMVKVNDTPERFPRRPGVASKRPLGAR